MPISQADLHAILRQIPERQRDEARQHILMADAAGWSRVALWVWFEGRQNVADLVGISPRGVFSFLANTRIRRNLK